MNRRQGLGFVVLGLLTLAALSLLRPAAAPAVRAQGSGEVEFTVEAATVESFYPDGMEFTIVARSEAGEIARARLIYELRSGNRQSLPGEFDAESEAWVARPFDSSGSPPWIDFDYWWQLIDSEGHSFETEPQRAAYEDHTREWQHIDTDDITLYWFGIPDEIGELVAEAMADMRESFEVGWGSTLSYKPLAILFPDRESISEWQAGGFNPNAGGQTSSAWGGTVQVLSSEAPPDFLMECVERWGLMTERPMEWRIQRAASTVVHETTHLYQHDFRALRGPAWWIEGQADYFAWLTGLDADPAERLTRLLTVTDDLPTLQGDGPPLNLYVMAADSCNALGYDMGLDFIRWLLDNYGGLETHRAILEAMQAGNPIGEALEIVTGVPFVELENQWRATWGLGPAAPPPTLPPVTLPTFPMGGATPQPGN